MHEFPTFLYPGPKTQAAKTIDDLKREITTKPFYAFKDKNEIIALCAYSPTHWSPDYSHCALLRSAYTHPAHRGKGLASQLLTFIENDITQRTNATHILTEIFQHNRAALRYFKNKGYDQMRAEHDFDAEIDGVTYPLHRLSKKIIQ